MLGGRFISAFVITYNEEGAIRDCLESLKWADEIVVVDSHSTDRTVEIARQYTDRIILHDFAGHTAQTRFAFEQTSGEWTLWLDADEVLTQRALDEIYEAFDRPGGPQHDGYAFPRKTYFLGRWVRHGGWYPQHRLRLMRREVASIVGPRAHPRAVVEGKVRKLRGEILHLSYPGGILEYIERSRTYAEISAQERFEQGRRAGLLDMVCRPPLTFLSRYVLKLGVLDGVAGLAVAAGAAYHRFVRDLRLYELERVSGPELPPPPRMRGGV